MPGLKVRPAHDSKMKHDLWRLNFTLFAPAMLRIKTKDVGIVSFELNMVQRRVWNMMCDAVARGRQPWFVILKARQLGMSTLCAAIVYWLVSLNQGRNALVVGYDEESTQRLFEMSRLFWDGSDPRYRPRTKYSHKRLIDFREADAKGLNSFIEVETARNTEAGRSYTLHAIHATEVALWRNADKTMLSLKQALPDRSWFFSEFTANGVSNYGYRLWQETIRHENDMTAIFAPWFWDPGYAIPFADQASKKEFEHTLTEVELDLIARCNVSMEQLAWRRWCIRNKCENNEENFRQEYPSSPDEAFLMSGHSVFNRVYLMEQRKNAKDGVRGSIRRDGTFMQNAKGEMTMYHAPQEGMNYYAGWDISMGQKNSDPEAGTIVDRALRTCAMWHGKLDPIRLAEPVIGMGRMYRNAITAIERNKMGVVTLHEVMKEYPYLFRQQNLGEYAAQQASWGWHTNVSSKSQLVAYAIHMTQERIPELNDIGLIVEMDTYMEHGPSDWGGAAGCKDDRVQAWMIACFVAKTELKGNIETGVTHIEEKRPEHRRYRSGEFEIFMPEARKGPDKSKGGFRWMWD